MYSVTQRAIRKLSIWPKFLSIREQNTFTVISADGINLLFLLMLIEYFWIHESQLPVTFRHRASLHRRSQFGFHWHNLLVWSRSISSTLGSSQLRRISNCSIGSKNVVWAEIWTIFQFSKYFHGSAEIGFWISCFTLFNFL